MKKSDERFERLFQELKAFRENSNCRFEAMDRRFEAMREDTNRRFDIVDRKLENLQDLVGIVVRCISKESMTKSCGCNCRCLAGLH